MSFLPFFCLWMAVIQADFCYVESCGQLDKRTCWNHKSPRPAQLTIQVSFNFQRTNLVLKLSCKTTPRDRNRCLHEYRQRKNWLLTQGSYFFELRAPKFYSNYDREKKCHRMLFRSVLHQLPWLQKKKFFLSRGSQKFYTNIKIWHQIYSARGVLLLWGDSL